jgi:hypothetical protein
VVHLRSDSGQHCHGSGGAGKPSVLRIHSCRNIPGSAEPRALLHIVSDAMRLGRLDRQWRQYPVIITAPCPAGDQFVPTTRGRSTRSRSDRLPRALTGLSIPSGSTSVSAVHTLNLNPLRRPHPPAQAARFPTRVSPVHPAPGGGQVLRRKTECGQLMAGSSTRSSSAGLMDWSLAGGLRGRDPAALPNV